MKKSFPLLIAGCLIFVSLFGAAACSKDEDADLKKDAHKISASAEDNICEHCGKKLYEGEIEYTLSDNQKYYIAEISRADGDVIVPGYYKDLGEEDYLPVLEVAVPENYASSACSFDSLEFSATVEHISIVHLSGNFAGEIKVPEKNKHYKSIDGVLFNKAGTKLVYYPSNLEQTSYTVPASVEEIGKLAFSRPDNLKKIQLSENGNLKKISSQAFYRCEKVESIIIPKSVETIENEAFATWSWTVYVRFKENEIPDGWGNVFINGSNTKIVYGYTGE
ncbi:MAG: leucine-rich repeat protein [Christensenellaceae bacterium]|jgi:choline binding protein pcpA|nr:MAG: hypothetical protein DBY05_02190 [Clostridiales bacterium]